MIAVLKRKLNFSIKLRIYSSFLLFGFLFFLTAGVVMTTVYKTRSKALHITSVIDPSLKQLTDFHNIILHSKTYSTNWVFLGEREADKDSLLKIHDKSYKQVKDNLSQLSQKWINKNNVDSLQSVFLSFDKIIAAQRQVMDLLQQPADYNNLSKKSAAEEIIRFKIIPAADAAIRTLYSVISKERLTRIEDERMLEAAFKKLWIIIIASIVSIIFLGFILSKYLAAIIVRPINQIRSIVDDLALGVTNKIYHKYQQNEIGKMVNAVNNLSDRLQYTAFFAKNVGERKYDLPFEPLSDEDILGQALVTMRDNLRSMDESLNQAQHIARLGNWEWNFTTDNIYWSDEMYSIFGKEAGSFNTSFESVIEHIHPEEKEEALKLFEECLENGKSFSIENRFIINDRVKHIFTQVNVMKDRNDHLCKLFGIMQDITERVQHQQELNQTIERFHILSKATNESIWDWNLVTDEVWWNENFYKAFDYDPANGIPKVGEWVMKLFPEDRDKMVMRLKSLRHSKDASWQEEFRYIKTDGSVGTASNRAYVLRDSAGEPIRVIGAIRDITERRKAQHQVEESEKRYRQIVETAQEGIWLINENNNTTFVNKKMAEMLEYGTEEILGKLVYDLVDESEQENVREQIDRRKTGAAEQHELKLRSKNGKLVYTYITTNAIVDEHGHYKGALAMVTDISQRKQQEQILKQHEEELQRKNKELERKNRELEQFAYIASHDLQEPLRTVASFAEHFQKQYKDRIDDMGQKYLHFIQQGTERMKTLITDLLEYSRIGKKRELKPVDCNEIISNVVADLNTAILESKVEIETSHLPVVKGYTTEMKQLFQNLMANAIKFRKKEAAPKICISSRQIDGGWEFTVKDNGIGIPEEHKERIFIIFQRLHSRSEYEGSGIGLSHCKKIVELHGGKIWVSSKPGEGSTFHFTILENHN